MLLGVLLYLSSCMYTTYVILMCCHSVMCVVFPTVQEREVAQQRVEELVCQHEAARQSLLEELDRLQQEKERFVQSKEAEVAQALSQTGEEVRHLAEQLDWANAKVMEKEGALRLAVKEKEEAAKKWEVESRQQEVCLKAKESEVQNLAARMEEMKRYGIVCLTFWTAFKKCVIPGP